MQSHKTSAGRKTRTTLAITLLAGALALSACGKKGELLPPPAEPAAETTDAS